MNPVVFIRTTLAQEDERLAAARHFPIVERRTAIPSGSLVVARYSALPFYEELEADLETLGSKLLNTYRQHCYVADLRNWYYDLGDFTPRTWFALDQIPDEGPFVLKGATNSKKQQWDTHMFAADKRAAIDVFGRLCDDGYVGHQAIYVRKYVPLKRLMTGLNGLPVSEEYRVFVLDGEIVSGAFYWQSFADDIDPLPQFSEVPRDWLDPIIKIVAQKIRFFVIDVARTEAGDWIVVELNDGQQSGLSCINGDVFYGRLREMLHG
jgi:hypothetical protein